eukprot:351801-Chlamydomonas_euryale.AAC.1
MPGRCAGGSCVRGQWTGRAEEAERAGSKAGRHGRAGAERVRASGLRVGSGWGRGGRRAAAADGLQADFQSGFESGLGHWQVAAGQPWHRQGGPRPRLSDHGLASVRGARRGVAVPGFFSLPWALVHSFPSCTWRSLRWGMSGLTTSDPFSWRRLSCPELWQPCAWPWDVCVYVGRGTGRADETERIGFAGRNLIPMENIHTLEHPRRSVSHLH